jgi:acetylglutamate kinase
VTALQSALGATPSFVDGRRVTTASDIDVVRMALSGSANKRLVAELQRAGVPAIGLSGEDGSLIGAMPADPGRLGHVGTPVRIEVSILHLLITAGFVPVVSPVSRNIDQSSGLGAALNVNGDDAAAAIAAAVGAAELLLVSDVEGVMQGGALVRRLSAGQVETLLAGSDVTGGMRAKLQAARSALAGGVSRVRISDLAAIDEAGRGTSLEADATDAPGRQGGQSGQAGQSGQSAPGARVATTGVAV